MCIRDSAEKKLQKAVGPFTDLLRYADVRLTVHGGNAGKGRREHKAEVTVHTKGRGVIRAEVRHEDMYASIDKAADKIQRQVRCDWACASAEAPKTHLTAHGTCLLYTSPSPRDS